MEHWKTYYIKKESSFRCFSPTSPPLPAGQIAQHQVFTEASCSYFFASSRVVAPFPDSSITSPRAQRGASPPNRRSATPCLCTRSSARVGRLSRDLIHERSRGGCCWDRCSGEAEGRLLLTPPHVLVFLHLYVSSSREPAGLLVFVQVED